MLVGEQPGDEEDRRGEPFVGPAGRLLDAAIEEAGLDRKSVYVTNAVKHFKWEPRGKRRLHKKPGLREINACNVWLEQEITEIAPGTIVALGSTARAGAHRRRLDDCRRRAGPSCGTGRARESSRATIPPPFCAPQGEHARLLRKSLIADLRLADRLAGESESARAP